MQRHPGSTVRPDTKVFKLDDFFLTMVIADFATHTAVMRILRTDVDPPALNYVVDAKEWYRRCMTEWFPRALAGPREQIVALCTHLLQAH